jgi:YHYH protein/Secretion system C-terminal sorting domain
MRSILIIFTAFLLQNVAFSQTNPAITAWLQNTSNIKGRHYLKGNSTPIIDDVLANVQKVQYSATAVYINATGIPAYITGPFLDKNPSLATNQNAIFKFTLNPTKNTGTPKATTGGNIGVFVNGVALFDYRDGVAWNAATNSLCGGPGNPPCPGGMGAVQDWNRDAVLAERAGFDCAKAHPANGNYHHHQNPSAFNLDKEVLSNVCDLYASDGLYQINTSKHSPLIGFAYDGFPIYGAYGFKNTDGTGGIIRMKSSYKLRNITERKTSPTGATVSAGAPINATYPLGYFREDYEYTQPSTTQTDYLDDHNGRFCVTPEYPKGIYAYFCTVDEKHNSAYPYVVGPTFYGVYSNAKVTAINEAVTTYTPTVAEKDVALNSLNINVFPNPATDVVAVQIDAILYKDMEVTLHDLEGKLIEKTTFLQGSTIVYFDTQKLYGGTYIVTIKSGKSTISKNIVILK